MYSECKVSRMIVYVMLCIESKTIVIFATPAKRCFRSRKNVNFFKLGTAIEKQINHQWSHRVIWTIYIDLHNVATSLKNNGFH